MVGCILCQYLTIRPKYCMYIMVSSLVRFCVNFSSAVKSKLRDEVTQEDEQPKNGTRTKALSKWRKKSKGAEGSKREICDLTRRLLEPLQIATICQKGFCCCFAVSASQWQSCYSSVVTSSANSPHKGTAPQEQSSQDSPYKGSPYKGSHQFPWSLGPSLWL